MFENWKAHYDYLLRLESTRPLNHSEVRELMAIEETLENGLCPDCGDSRDCTLCNEKQD